jgi:integrase
MRIVRSRSARISSFTDLRRTYASILLNDGEPAAFVAQQLGHTVDVLFRTYAGLIENQQGQHRERQLGAVEAFRSGATG